MQSSLCSKQAIKLLLLPVNMDFVEQAAAAPRVLN